jgi:hypothetical protein
VACMTTLGTYIGYKIGKFIGKGSQTGLTIRKMPGGKGLPAMDLNLTTSIPPRTQPAAEQRRGRPLMEPNAGQPKPPESKPDAKGNLKCLPRLTG